MRSRVPRGRVSQDRWLVSYADFVTLLFGFFVVLYAFAQSRPEEADTSVAGHRLGFNSMGVFSDSASIRRSDGRGGSPANAAMGEDADSPAQVKYDLDRIRRDSGADAFQTDCHAHGFPWRWAAMDW